jgi:hypothetical protein
MGGDSAPAPCPPPTLRRGNLRRGVAIDPGRAASRSLAPRGRAPRRQFPDTIIGSITSSPRVRGSTVTFTQWVFGLPKVSRRVKFSSRSA